MENEVFLNALAIRSSLAKYDRLRVPTRKSALTALAEARAYLALHAGRAAIRKAQTSSHPANRHQNSFSTLQTLCLRYWKLDRRVSK